MAHTRSLLIGGLCAALVLSLLLGMRFLQTRKEEEVYLVYTALFEVDAALAEGVCVGEALTDARGKGMAGEVLKVTRERALREDAFGIYSLPDRVTLAVTVGGEGIKRAGETKIGTLIPRVGEAVYLLGRTRLEGICIRVREL